VKVHQVRVSAPTTLRWLRAGLTLVGILLTLADTAGSGARALVQPARETGRASLWRRLYDEMPAAWKSRSVVVVREVPDREMDRLVREGDDPPSRDPNREDEVQGFFEYAGPRQETPTIVLRESLGDSEAAFVFTHEYGHFIWEEKLTRREQDEYYRVWNRQRRGRRLISAYAADSVVEGFAEAFAHFLRRPSLLHRRDIDSEEFLQDWLDERTSRSRAR